MYMSRFFKIFLTIFIIAIVLLFVARFFHLDQYLKQQACPSDSCTYNKNADARSMVFKPEPGRTHQDFAPAIPPVFPKGVPVDPKPLKVLQSYVETMQNSDDEAGVAPHTQITYVYITNQSMTMMADNFEKYLAKNKYDINKNPENSQTQYFLSGRKVSGSLDESIIVNIVAQNQFEKLVTISVLIASASNPKQ